MCKCKLAKTHWTIYVAVLIIAISFILWVFDECWCILYVFFDGKKSLSEIMTYAGATAGGLILIGNLLANQQRAKEQQKTNDLTRTFHKLTEKGHLDTRFNNAVGHLSNENSAIVLSGIHVLHQIAIEHTDYVQVIHNLFCSYLRENSARLYEKSEFLKTPEKCPIIIQTLIDYLFKPYNNKDSVYKEYKSDLSFSTLKKCNFEIELNDVNFSNSILEDCGFTTLTGCNFSKGTLTECHFRDGILTNCKFYCNPYHNKITLTNCYFSFITLIDCHFEGGTLTSCEFLDATLTNCKFHAVTLTNCKFFDEEALSCFECTFINCDFKFGTTLTNCDFKRAIMTDCILTDGHNSWRITLTNCDFRGGSLTNCKFNSTTLTDCTFLDEDDYTENAQLFVCDIKNIILDNTKLPLNLSKEAYIAVIQTANKYERLGSILSNWTRECENEEEFLQKIKQWVENMEDISGDNLSSEDKNFADILLEILDNINNVRLIPIEMRTFELYEIKNDTDN